LAGRCELLCQLLAPSHLFGMVIPVAIHEELRRRNVSEVPRKDARNMDAEVPYLAGQDDNITQRAQRGGQGF
jgi:hypothetical protein